MSHAANKYVKHLVQSPNGDPLSIGEKLVLTQLADDHNEDRRQAWPSIPHLAGRACMSVRNCRRLLRSLERKGVLETCLQLRAGNDGQTSNAYRFPAIDPPFDTHVVATTRKRMELRRSANERARSAQLQLETPPDAGVRGSAASVAVAHAPAAFVREGRTRTSGGAGHGRPGGADTGVRGPRTRASGGIEPLLNLQGNHEEEPSWEPTTPLPPSQGRRGSRREFARELAMARESPRGRALDDAARAVLAGCAVSGTQAVKLHATLWMALEAACKRAGKPPEEHAADVAERMLAAWKEHMELGRVLKFRWGLHRFFGEGHWLNTAGWVVDQEKLKQLRMQRNASVGSY